MSSRAFRAWSAIGLSGVVLLACACLPPPSARVRARAGGGATVRAPDLLGALLGGVAVEAGSSSGGAGASATVAGPTQVAPAVSRTPSSGATVAAGVVETTSTGSGATLDAATSGNGMTGATRGGEAIVTTGAGAGARGTTTVTTTTAFADAQGRAIVAGGAGAGTRFEAGATGGGSRFEAGAGGGGSRIEAGAGAELDVRVDLEAGVARRRVGRGMRFADLVEGGWVVDGARVRLEDLGALGATVEATSTTTVVGASDASSRGDGALLSSGSVGAWAELEHVELPTSGGDTRLVVRVAGLAPTVPRGRLRVHLVLDRSSSMDGTWHHVLAAARQLVARLSADDVLQIVTYADRAEEVFGPAPIGDGREAMARLEAVTVGGGTNIEAGVSLAYRSLARVPAMPGDRSLVFLVSDGRPNIGAFAADDFARLTIDARASGCTTAVFGLGDEFDGDVLRAIARAGRGSYYVARTAAELTQPLVNELGVQERIAGLDVRVRIRLPAAVQVRGVEGADSVEAGNVLTAVFPVLRVGEERRIVLALGVRASVEPRDIAAVDVAYRARHDARPIAAARRVRMGFATAPRYAGASVGVSLMDQDLARAMDEAGTAVRIGDGARASRALADHVARVRARPDLAALAPVRARTDAVARLATGISAMLPAAREPERRLVGLALGSTAVRLGR
ncbi:MAG: VWA domain-containing protein [Deltaproteobacteria bacterium]|nr:VWA domain-containing protein [Deltaproteobacteria bacterium]